MGADVIASIRLHPDYNLAVEPATNGGTAQNGKFQITLNTAASYSVTVTYTISGTASNGVDYTLSGSGTISAGQTNAIIEVQPLYDTLPEFDESVTLTLVLSNGYLVNPSSATATLKIYDPRPSGMAVAILDSGWTRFNKLSTTNWNYFVLPEAMKEAMRSDGTPYVVVSDLDIANGVLLNTNGTPKYPILISLCAESIRDEEIAALTNYVAAGGFVFAGGSAFTKMTNGGFRSNFALAGQMGIGCSPSTNNWYNNTNFTKQIDHPMLRDIPEGQLVWRMPTSPEETSWGTCHEHSLACITNKGFEGPHQIWVVTNSTASVLATEDGSYPYITVKSYGSGQYIYDAALQPLIGHGGFAPGMYTYMIFRRAIEWAFESAQRPVVKVSPWPYQYNAAFMIRHDLEDYADEISDIYDSAAIEYANWAFGDYYFSTGRITNEANYASIVTGLQYAVSTYGATIGPHNGGLPNPHATDSLASCCVMNNGTYEYWHWGLDEALDLDGGKDYASNSLAIAFAQVDSWVTNRPGTPRLWCAPYFNATREDSYEIEEALGVKITGDQKLTPFPAFTISTRTDGKRYTLLSEPVSDWFVNGSVAQSMDPWHSPGIHTTNTVHAGVDFYYTNGLLVNFYAHGLTTGLRSNTASYLIPDYVGYCMNTNAFPRLWSTNACGVYQWWLKRANTRVSASYATTNGTHSLVTVAVTGAEDTNTSVEVLAAGFGTTAVSRIWTNGAVAGTNSYRTIGELIKVRVGTTVTNVVLEYFPGPVARSDFYTMVQGQTLSAATNGGVLTNDVAGTWPGLFATNVTGISHGSLSLSSDGSFSYTPNSNFWGTECFSYEARDSQGSYGNAGVSIFVRPPNAFFADDFSRCPAQTFLPWQTPPAPSDGDWSLGGGSLQGGSSSGLYGYCFLATNWTSCSVQAQIAFSAGGYGGGIGARLNPTTGAHYAAWIYPEKTGSPSNVLAIIKFSTWTTWGNDPSASNGSPLAQVGLASVGTTNHTVKLAVNGSTISAFFDELSTPKVSASDADYSSGGISFDLWTGSFTYTMSVQGLIVTNAP